MAEVKKMGALYCVVVGDTIVFRSLTRAHAIHHAALWNVKPQEDA